MLSYKRLHVCVSQYKYMEFWHSHSFGLYAKLCFLFVRFFKSSRLRMKGVLPTSPVCDYFPAKHGSGEE